MPALPSFKKERQSLKAVTSSECFNRAPILTRLLTYLCEAYFEGRGAKLKEYSIAVDGLGRSADSDDNGSAVARVQMHRLRAKLTEYYEHEGLHDPLRIVLKPGVYTPHFVAVDSPPVGSHPRVAEPPDAPPPPGLWPRLQPRHWLWGGLALALVLAAVLVAIRGRQRDSVDVQDQPGSLSSLSLGSTGATGSTGIVSSRGFPERGIRILPGSDKSSTVDAMGNIWPGDRYFSGGEAQVTPAALLGLTSDPALFETYRQGDFTYKIPLAAGAYELHLYFADFLGPRFDLQPKKNLTDFMLFINDGNPWKHQSRPLTYGSRPPLETEKIFKDISPAKDGFLSLHFKPLLNFAFINAVSILPTPDGKARPIRIVAQQKPVTDQHGHIWSPDRYFTGGNLVVHGVQVSGTSDPQLLAGERYGNFQYIVPVAASTYTLKLYFVETWLGKGGLGGGGVGSRVFQVDINDDRVLRHFDILAESGAPGRPVIKTFPGITPDADGNIVLSFIPIENSACVNAIEIIDEGGEPPHAGTPQ